MGPVGRSVLPSSDLALLMAADADCPPLARPALVFSLKRRMHLASLVVARFRRQSPRWRCVRGGLCREGCALSPPPPPSVGCWSCGPFRKSVHAALGLLSGFDWTGPRSPRHRTGRACRSAHTHKRPWHPPTVGGDRQCGGCLVPAPCAAAGATTRRGGVRQVRHSLLNAASLPPPPTPPAASPHLFLHRWCVEGANRGC